MQVRLLLLFLGVILMTGCQAPSVDSPGPAHDRRPAEQWTAAEKRAFLKAQFGDVEQTLNNLSEATRDKLALDQMDFSVYPPTGAEKMARADLANGHIFIFTGGLNIYLRDGLKEYLQEQYQITVLDIADCEGGQYVFDFMDQYNAPVEAWLEQRHGCTHREMIDEANDALNAASD
jgi:hypothetical protein